MGDFSEEVINSLKALTKRVETLERELGAMSEMLGGTMNLGATEAGTYDLSEIEFLPEEEPAEDFEAVEYSDPQVEVNVVSEDFSRELGPAEVFERDGVEPIFDESEPGQITPGTRDKQAAAGLDEELTTEETGTEPESIEENWSGDTFDLFGEYAVEPTGGMGKGANRAGKTGKTTAGDALGMPAWRTDSPGTYVRDIRSAISLNDRVMFINSLFRGDYLLFQDTVNRLNATNDLSEAVTYIHGTFPEWDMNSETVYRFMMAARRKLR